jgi:hypothetical protein
MATIMRPMPKVTLAYVDDAIIDCRLRGMYNALHKGRYDKVCESAWDTLLVLQNAQEVDMELGLTKRVMEDLCCLCVDLAMRNYDDAHERIRSLHYDIMNMYNP